MTDIVAPDLEEKYPTLANLQKEWRSATVKTPVPTRVKKKRGRGYELSVPHVLNKKEDPDHA